MVSSWRRRRFDHLAKEKGCREDHAQHNGLSGGLPKAHPRGSCETLLEGRGNLQFLQEHRQGEVLEPHQVGQVALLAQRADGH